MHTYLAKASDKFFIWSTECRHKMQLTIGRVVLRHKWLIWTRLMKKILFVLILHSMLRTAAVIAVILWMAGLWRDEFWASGSDDPNYWDHSWRQVHRPRQRSVFSTCYLSFPCIDFYCVFLEQLLSVMNFKIFRNNKKLSCRRDRATLRVVEYFAKSLEVIRNDTVK